MLRFLSFINSSVTNPSPQTGFPFNSNTVLIVLSLITGGIILCWIMRLSRGVVWDVPTVSDISYFAQKAAWEGMGEREFARRLLELDRQLGDDLEKGLRYLAQNYNKETKQVFYCWLERRGYGKMPLHSLWANVEMLKNNRDLDVLADSDEQEAKG
ncbi:MAG TPA: hypothetical protein VH186_12495 [Chloroflexia bacterium]|nr:hypothetical protein [Chloroflexia bacterium]